MFLYNILTYRICHCFILIQSFCFPAILSNQLLPLRQLQQLIASASQYQNNANNANSVLNLNTNSILSRTSYSTKSPLLTSQLTNATATSNNNANFLLNNGQINLASLLAQIPVEQYANLSFKSRQGDLHAPIQTTTQQSTNIQLPNAQSQKPAIPPIQQQQKSRSIAIANLTAISNMTSPINFLHHQANNQDQTKIFLKQSSSASRQKWNLMELSMGEHIESLAFDFKLSLDKILQKTNISTQCSSAFHEFTDSLVKQKLWALQIFDSSAHNLPNGFLQGTLTDLGHYDQCLSIQQAKSHMHTNSSEDTLEPIAGQYCTIIIKPAMYINSANNYNLRLQQINNNQRYQTICSINRQAAQSQAANVQFNAVYNETLMSSLRKSVHFQYNGLRLGICSPNACSRNDLQQMLNNYLSKWHLTGFIKSCDQQTSKISDSNKQAVDWLWLRNFDTIQCSMM